MSAKTRPSPSAIASWAVYIGGEAVRVGATLPKIKRGGEMIGVQGQLELEGATHGVSMRKSWRKRLFTLLFLSLASNRLPFRPAQHVYDIDLIGGRHSRDTFRFPVIPIEPAIPSASIPPRPRKERARGEEKSHATCLQMDTSPLRCPRANSDLSDAVPGAGPDQATAVREEERIERFIVITYRCFSRVCSMAWREII